MMDQQRETQNQQQQQRSSHHRRPPDVEEALSSMLWTPYERTPTESSSDDDDERLNRKLRKSQSSHDYYQYGGLTLAPPAAIMPYFGSNDPITPFVPLSNQHDSVRNNNNINNSSSSILSYSGTSINNNGGVGGGSGTDYFRKTDRCDNFRFSYPYYGPIPSLNKCLSVEPPSYDSLYTKSKDATRVLSNLVTVSATPASGYLRTAAAYAAGSGCEPIELNASCGRMVHSFTDNFVIECNSSSSPSVSSSTSSTTSVAHHQQQNTPQQYNNEMSSNITTCSNNNIPLPITCDVSPLTTNEDKNKVEDNEHKANGEQKQTEVNQLTPATPMDHQQQQKQQQQHYQQHSAAAKIPNDIAITNISKQQYDDEEEEQEEKQPQKQPKQVSTTLQHETRTSDNEGMTERSHLGEPSEVSSLSTFVANGLGVIACRSLSFTVTTTTTAATTVSNSSSSPRGLKVKNGGGGRNPKSRHVQLADIDPPPHCGGDGENHEIIVNDLSSSRSYSFSGSAEDIVALAMRLNIPATGTDAPPASASASQSQNLYTNNNRGGKNVSVTTSSVFLSNSISAHHPKGNINNNNNVAILSSRSAPSLTIQVNDSCINNVRSNNNNSPNTASHGDFVVNQSIANNGISVVNCTYANSVGVGVGEGSVINSKNSSSSSVPKSSKIHDVNKINNNNNNLTDIQCSTSSSTTGTTNGLQQPHLSPTRTFTSTECQTDDIPILIRDDVNGGGSGGGSSGPPPHTVIATSAINGGHIGGVDGNSALVRSPLHPDALLSREQRRRERRERRQQQQQHVQQQQQMQQHQRLSRHHSHSHPPSQQPPLLQHPAHHTMSAAAAAMLRPMLPDILHSHFPPPYSALPLSQGAPPPPPPLPPHAASLITPVISTVPIAATATMVGDGRFSIPLPIIRRSPSERSGKGCCGQWFAGPPLRALIAVVALGGVACALGGAALGATGLAGPPSSHLTAALLMIGVGVVLVTVSGAAWRLTAPGGPPCLGLGSSVDLGRCGRRPCSRGGGAPHGLLYPEFQHRPPPPSYQASMQEYRLRLLLLDRDRQNGVVRGSSPPPTYRSHTGSLLRAPLTTTIRGGGGPGSEYSLPPSYRSRNATPAIISCERSIETAPSGRLLANEDIPESSLCTISSNLDSSLPAYNAIISENLHQQQTHQQQNFSLSRNSQEASVPENNNPSDRKDNATTVTTTTATVVATGNSKMVPQKQITPSALGNDGHQSSSNSKEYPSSGDRTSLSLLHNSSPNGSGAQSNHPREQLLQLSEKLNPRVLANSTGGGANNRNPTIGFLNIHSAKSSQTPDSSMTTGKTKDLVTIVTISAQDHTSNLQHNSMQLSSPASQGEMDILAHL
ncbi:uncharacterized protein LOC129949191 [Eupeodes corollae]|uniref:uncharacterized protein LOC129949191 n=1 Tax=Eupeodes corollae TaxID=290404 RepID=UPI002493C681|nr:uncharacterized protein LOC129949191 [Eupeodes corollae]